MKKIHEMPGHWIRMRLTDSAKQRLVMLAAQQTLAKGKKQSLEVVATEYFEKHIADEIIPGTSPEN